MLDRAPAASTTRCTTPASGVVSGSECFGPGVASTATGARGTDGWGTPRPTSPSTTSSPSRPAVRRSTSPTPLCCAGPATRRREPTGGPHTRVLRSWKTAPPDRVHAAEFRQKYPCPPRARFARGRPRWPTWRDEPTNGHQHNRASQDHRRRRVRGVAAEHVGIRPSTAKRHLADLRARSGMSTEQLIYSGRAEGWLVVPSLEPG